MKKRENNYYENVLNKETMQELNKYIIALIEKYPFLSDPIVLFSASKIPTKEEILLQKKVIKYPLIKKARKNLKQIKKDFFLVEKEVKNHHFKDFYLRKAYFDRLRDFYKIIRLLECFYEKEEYEKSMLLEEYFWIDIGFLAELFQNKDVILSHFDTKKSILDENIKKKLSTEMLDAKEIQFYFKEALKHLGLERIWKVELWDVVSIVHTNFRGRGWTILIPSHRSMTKKRLLALIAHEIDGHSVQFSGWKWIFSWAIRFSKSESLVEWYALYLEYLFLSKVFWEEDDLKTALERSEKKFRLLNNSLDFDNLITNYIGNHFRIIRGFKDYKNYQNTKDFVYIQWLYKVIKYKEKYTNLFSLLKEWAVNDTYIKQKAKKWNKKEKIELESLGAYYILDTYFKN